VATDDPSRSLHDSTGTARTRCFGDTERRLGDAQWPQVRVDRSGHDGLGETGYADSKGQPGRARGLKSWPLHDRARRSAIRGNADGSGECAAYDRPGGCFRGVVFTRAGMDRAESRSTIAHEVWHLAVGPEERGARRYEAQRRRGAWWAPPPPEPVEPTAESGRGMPGVAESSRAVGVSPPVIAGVLAPRGSTLTSWRQAAASSVPGDDGPVGAAGLRVTSLPPPTTVSTV
jgi:hypothetical protein